MAEAKKAKDEVAETAQIQTVQVSESRELAFVGDETTVQKKLNFIAALAEYGSPGPAARIAGAHRATFYKWRNDDPAFAAAWDAAVDDAMDDVELALLKRGKEKDTIAAIFMLKGHRPDKYSDRVKAEVNHTGTAPILTPAEREARLRDILGEQPH